MSVLSVKYQDPTSDTIQTRIDQLTVPCASMILSILKISSTLRACCDLTINTDTKILVLVRNGYFI